MFESQARGEEIQFKIMRGALLALLALTGFSSALGRPSDDCRNVTREGPSLFGGTPTRKHVAIVQCGNIAVGVPDFDLLEAGFANVSYALQSV